MTAGENRFNPTFLAAFNKALDEIEKMPGALALVVTGQDKFFSNGLDLNWMGQHAKESKQMVADVQKLFARLLTFPVMTCAALNGHAFAGGAMLAMCLDYRVMRADRGFLCLPEIDLGMVLLPGMGALIEAKANYRNIREFLFLGLRINASQALESGLIDQVVDADAVLPAAVKLLTPMAPKCASDTARGVMASHKQFIYRTAVALLAPAEPLPKL
eukprot:TRINITY_DN5148_c0_g1_i1.p1 TRINITY_DN5148_c0_g1~~TRINITY_DN5148_c0_g1_i1.p1  ORF type:complete len:216 (-),score=46.15 TRINITY_DN5148_c0_g1_i1:2-649(-)